MSPVTEKVLREEARRISVEEKRHLFETYIEPDPHKIGPAEARLRQSGVPVWAIIGHLPSVSGDLEQAARDYDVSLEAVRACVLFYYLHSDLIDWRLRQNYDDDVAWLA